MPFLRVRPGALAVLLACLFAAGCADLPVSPNSPADLGAASGPNLVVAVSCNPATLARDARLLVGGGYRLIKAIPIDQFPWAAQLESVAVFKRAS